MTPEPTPADVSIREAIGLLIIDGMREHISVHANEHRVPLSAFATADAILALSPVLTDGWVWKWVERALFDKQIGMKPALKTLAHYPGAPWNIGRWDVDHKPYADAFYKTFPKAQTLSTPKGEGK